jgi:hypothetical protein
MQQSWLQLDFDFEAYHSKDQAYDSKALTALAQQRVSRGLYRKACLQGPELGFLVCYFRQCLIP